MAIHKPRIALQAAILVALLVCAGLVFPSSASAGRIEAGTFTAHDTFSNPDPVRIPFQQPFDTVPVVIALVGVNGGNSATIRITNVTTTGFDELTIEPDSFDGRHIVEEVHYLAVEPGRHVLPGGFVIEAGLTTTAAVQHGAGVSGTMSWDSISFSSALPSIPSVLAQIQSANSETQSVAAAPSRPYITATLQAPSASGFQLALERSETQNGPIPSSEQVGWIAFPAGSGGSFPDTGGSSITWNALTTSRNIAGYDDGCFTNSLGLTSASAIVVAKKVTRFGGDGGWLRRCSLTSSAIGLTVDEDTSRDTERNHTTEQASILAFSQSFHANLAAALNITKARTGVTNTLGSDFALPDALVDYQILVSNVGNAPPNEDSVVVTEQLPIELALSLADFGAPGTGPVQFAQGSTPSNLNCTFAAFSSASDCYDFSTDGSDYSYEPSDSGNGTDPNVRYIRIRPSGFMAANLGSGAPSFELRFRTQIR